MNVLESGVGAHISHQLYGSFLSILLPMTKGLGKSNRHKFRGQTRSRVSLKYATNTFNREPWNHFRKRLMIITKLYPGSNVLEFDVINKVKHSITILC